MHTYSSVYMITYSWTRTLHTLLCIHTFTHWVPLCTLIC